MSTDQPTLQDFRRKPRWKPQNDSGRCLSCGAHVDSELERTYGDNDNNLHACPDCATLQEVIVKGAGGDPEFDDWCVRKGESYR